MIYLTLSINLSSADEYINTHSWYLKPHLHVALKLLWKLWEVVWNQFQTRLEYVAVQTVHV